MTMNAKKILEGMLLDHSEKARNFDKARMPEPAKFHDERAKAIFEAIAVFEYRERVEKCREQIVNALGVRRDQLIKLRDSTHNKMYKDVYENELVGINRARQIFDCEGGTR